MSRVLRLGVLMFVTGALVACGIPAEDQPRVTAAEDVPFDLLAPAPDSPNPPSPEGATAVVQIYLMSSERLVAVDREVERPVDNDEVIERVIAGATASEKARGLGSEIPPRTQLLGSRLDPDDDVLTIDLSEEINTVQAEGQQRAIAQLVFTATRLRGVERVRFRVEGKPTPVPIGDGRQESSPVSPAQYPELRPRP